jgi:hypothetical protein
MLCDSLKIMDRSYFGAIGQQPSRNCLRKRENFMGHSLHGQQSKRNPTHTIILSLNKFSSRICDAPNTNFADSNPFWFLAASIPKKCYTYSMGFSVARV